MNYYKQGDAANSDKIKAAFEKKGIDTSDWEFINPCDLYFNVGSEIYTIDYKIKHIVTGRHDYTHLELPVEPKFKAEDRIVSKSDKSTIYRIITLHEERREYVVEIEHKDYHESCPWIAFEDQDDYELAPKPHYDIANFQAGMPVLVRDSDEHKWLYTLFGIYNKDNSLYPFVVVNMRGYAQCIPFEGNEHLLGTTYPCGEEYINW